jgi:LacI family transcriptional regulator
MKKLRKVALFFETSAINDRKMLQGIAKYCRLHNPWLFYNKSHPFYMMQGTGIWQQKVLPELKEWNPDGIIAHVNSKKAKELLSFRVPTILGALVEPEYLSSAYFADDNRAIAVMAAEYLLGLGFKNFAFCGFRYTYWSEERCNIFSNIIIKAGYKVDVYTTPKSHSRGFLQEDHLLLSQWLRSLPKPAVILACNDARAQQIIDSCKLAEFNVPEQVAVLGVDNDDMICDTTNPPLSSVALGTEKAGYEAARLLDNMMSGRKTKLRPIIISPTHIVTRQSTDILAIDDPEVAKAVSFIRTNRTRQITVDEVVEATTLARRALEQRFFKTLNRSIYSEIRRVCVEQVAKMLLETTMPVFQIAENLGFSSSEHIARPFRREKGISPKEYRRRFSY